MKPQQPLYYFIKTISVRNIDKIITCLESSSFNCEKWATQGVRELLSLHMDLRQDIKTYEPNWSYKDYCIRLSYHFYNLASYYYTLYYYYQIDLRTVAKYLEKCIRKLREVSINASDEEHHRFLKDAISMKETIDNMFNHELAKCQQSTVSSEYVSLCISLGNIFNDDVFIENVLKQTDVVLKQKFDTILLIRMMDLLEDGMSIPISKSHLVLAERCEYLSRLYMLAKCSEESKNYSIYADLLLKEAFFTENNINDISKKHSIKSTIKQQIENRKCLEEVNRIIEIENPLMTFNSVDYAFIQRKFLKYCLKHWFEETENYLQFLINDKNYILIHNIFENIHKTKHLTEVAAPLSELKYYDLLLRHIKLISQKDQQTYLINHNNSCIDQVIAFCGLACQELIFIDAFIAFLNTFKSHNIIFAELKLEKYYNDSLTFTELTSLIYNLDPTDYGDALKTVQDSLKALTGPDLFMNKTFKDILILYLKQVEIIERYVDGRTILEVTGKSIVLSSIKRELENKLSINPNVEEIRFVEADVFHVDQDLSKKIWHGMNIDVYAKKLKIYDKITWDVSGLDAHKYETDAGTDSEGNGKQGADGFAGESGGNVLIISDEIDDPTRLTIISCGGDGGRGQDGGKGQNGEDGKGLTKTEFQNKLPVFTRWFSEFSKVSVYIKENIAFIRSCPSLIEAWNDGSNNAQYFEASTTEKNEITMFYNGFHVGISIFQGLCLYTGSCGKVGKKGGEYGFGGQGGFAGEILVNTEKLENTDGKKGENGNGGQFGYHGKNGWDIGYFDCEHWSNPKFRGEYQNEKISIKYEYSSNSNNVYCRYRHAHLGKKDYYATFTVRGIKINKENKFEERAEMRQNKELQHQAKATKKKHISETNIRTQYSLSNSFQEKYLLQDMKSDIHSTLQKALNSVFEYHEEQEQHLSELNIKRNMVYSTTIDNHANIIQETKLNNTTDIQINGSQVVHQLIDSIKTNPTYSSAYLLLNSVELSDKDFSVIYSIFEENKCHIDAKHHNEIDLLLTNKYRFTVLQHLSKILPVYEDNKLKTKITSESASRFLTASEENSFDISHPIFGYISSYLFVNNDKNRSDIANFCKNVKTDDDEWSALENSLVLFVLEQGEKYKDRNVIKSYFDTFKTYTTKKDEILMEILSELVQTLQRNEYVYHLWCQSFIDKSFKQKFLNEISTDKLISSLYSRFIYYKEAKYDWGKCIKDSKVLKEYYKVISEHGTNSTCCLELLSHVYKINMRVYEEGKEGGYVLIGDYNENGGEIIYLLRKGKTLIKLYFDDEYYHLEQNYKIKNDICYKIIDRAFSADSILEVDRYFEETKKSILGIRNIHPTLNNFEHYLFSNEESHRDNVTKYFGKMKITDTALHKTIKLLILEEGKHKINENINQDAFKLLYKNYIYYLSKQKHSLLCLVEPMEYEIRAHANVFANNDKRERKSKLQNEFQIDPLFERIYSKFSQQLASEYDWSVYGTKKEILVPLKKKLRLGALEPCYREFLSFVYNVNIKVYVRKHKQFNLFYDHNPYSGNILRVEQIKDKLIPIGQDETQMLKFYEVTSNIPKIVNIFELKDFDENLEDIFKGINLEKDSVTNPKLSAEDDDNTINAITSFYNNQDDIINVKNVLEKISVKYIGETKLLQHLLKRFKCEGMHVDYKILCQLVNLIFKFIIEDKNCLHIFNWIILSFPQNEWMSEIILLQLENYFKKKLVAKEEWRKYMSRTENKDILFLISIKLYKEQQKVTMQCIDQILYLLSNIPLCKINLNLLDLSTWPCALKEKYWENKLKKLINWNDNESLYTVTYYIIFMENMYGHDLIKEFIDILNIKKNQLTPSTLIAIFSSLYNEKWNISKGELCFLSKNNVKRWISEMNKIFSADIERDMNNLEGLIKSNANTSDCIKELLENIQATVKRCDSHVFQIENRYTGIRGECNISTFSKDDITNWSRKTKTNYKNKTSESPKYELFLSVIDQAIFHTRGFHLRDTQKLSILTFLANKQNTLAQVSTGEGKSLIVASLAIIKGLLDEKVDIITSSSVLAKRDADIYKDIYALFGINVSHNCHEDIEKRKDTYSNNQVVYGDLANFQRDYLLDRFYRKNVLGNRDFCNVIIDEVDSMLLDRGNNTLYLSHNLKGLDKLESLYLYIWQSMNRPAADLHELLKSMDKRVIKESVVHDIFGTILKTDLETISDKLDDEKITILYNRMIKFKIIDIDGKLLINDMSEINIDEILSTKYIAYKDEIVFLVNETINREKRIKIPNYLRKFALLHLDAWINSAETALYLREGRDYVVDVDRTGTSPDMNPNITIIDKDTGTDQTNSEWDEVLHQFLQLKHGCKLSLQSLKAVFISNVSYFKLYKTLYGLTGTLGSKAERNLLKKIHNVQFVTIPTARPKVFIEYNPILCSNVEELKSKIVCEAKIITVQKNRSVLIICETVDEVKSLYKIFGGKEAKNVHTYIRDYEEFDLANGNDKLPPGVIIIATNLAGRGTDIKLSDELKQTGGLHVCLTYLPKNSRIEQQAFGRAARCGDMGSGQLIISTNAGTEFSCAQLLFLKSNRDIEEARRILEIETIYNNQIQIEEQCFAKFKLQYENLKFKLVDDEIPNDVADILLQSCLDNWAFWLDENCKLISNLKSIENRNQFETSFKEFIDNMEKVISLKPANVKNRFNPVDVIYHYIFKPWISYIFHSFVPTYKESYKISSCETGWIQDPIQLTSLGKCFAKNKYYREAIKIYDIVISREPKFSEAAHYYKAYALAKTFNWEFGVSDSQLTEFKTELKQAEKLFQIHFEFSTDAAGIIGKIKQNTFNNIIQINAYEEQKTAINNYYSLFLQSIDEILGSSVTPGSFASSDINEELAETIYKDLVNENILNGMEINNDLSTEIIQNLAYSYGTTSQRLKTFLSHYKGQQINEEEFHKELQRNINLPNREDFWKTLKARGVWENEIIYVVINKDRLKLLDPSLLDLIEMKIKKNEINEDSFHSNSKANIYLYTPEQLQQQNKNNIVITKHDFKLIIDNDLKYKTLKKRGIFTKNKRAALLIGNDCKTTPVEKTEALPKKTRAANLQAITFPLYDSIKAEDFAKENISSTEAKKIIDELVKNEVLKFENDEYRLNIDYDKLTDVKLKSFPVYENSVQTLLHFCFIYRIALQKLEDQKSNDNNINVIGIKLMSKPYTNLMMEMIDVQVIKQRERDKKPKGLEDKLNKLYRTTIFSNELSHVLNRHNFLYSNLVSNDLIKELQKQGWIDHTFSPMSTIESPLLRQILTMSISFTEPTPDELFKLLTVKKNTNSHLDTPFNSIEKTLRVIFENWFNVSQPDCIQRIANILDQSVSALLTLDTPDADLEPINDNNLRNLNVNIQEVHVFFLNCLDELITFKEKKWTVKMLLSVLAVIVIGIAQIIIGTVIELYSMGAMTHLAGAFISEGISDIMYALGALHSGYFSWKDYGKHKLYSVLTTAVTCGLAAYFSKGVKVSRIGHKVVGPTVEVGEKKVVEMTGKTLCTTLTKNVVYKEMGKRIASKAIEGLAFGAANIGVDILVENYIQKFCANISYAILSNVEKEVDGHDISKTLETIYSYLGLKKSKELVNNATEKYFKQKSIIEKFGPTASKILGCLTQAIAQASKKKSKLSEQKTPIDKIMFVITWAERALNITDLLLLTKTFLNDLNQQLTEKLNKVIADKNLQTNIRLDKQYDIMKMEMVTKWKTVLKDKAGQVVTQNIVSPLLKDGVNYLVRCAGKYIQKCYNDHKESGYTKQFEERKQQYINELAEESNQTSEDTIRLNDIKKRYHSDLIKIMQKTKNPQLFADIINEKVPMDMTCVTACTHIIHRILDSKGIHGFKITVTEEGWFKQTFSSTGDNNEKVIVNLTLKDNHFVFTGESSESSCENNCLFDALRENVPELNNMSSEMFRNHVVYHIKNDITMHNIIKRGWHRFAISQGALGGGDPIRKGRNLKEYMRTNEMNTDIENHKTDPNRGYTEAGFHVYDPKKDVDLRKKGAISISELHEQRAEGFVRGLEKINEKLCEIQCSDNPVTVSEANFQTTLSDSVLMRTKNGNVEVGFCPVEMQATIEVKAKVNGIKQTIKLTVELNMDNPKSGERGPKGPHIGWSVAGFEKTTGGHVFLNKKGNELMPRRTKESVYTQDFKPKDNSQTAAWNRHIPATRMFFSPHRPNVILRRVDELCLDLKHKDIRKRKSFTTCDL